MNINIAGHSFAETTPSAIKRQLFEAAPHDSLSYVRTARRIKFYRGPVQIAEIGKYGVLGSVTRLEDGRLWHSFAPIAGIGCPIEAAKGLDVEAIATRVAYPKYEREFWFK